jgi:EAL domain-containing protein (putative c-di-GMP-specific phosphodiesterase class I)/CheY-like chemotaxis protein
VTSATGSVRVLVADDEPVIRSALEDLITGAPGLEFVGAAADAQEAIDKAARLRPDVVLLDVRMPLGGGPRAAAEIDALPNGPSTVAFSAYDDRSAIMSMLDAGACGYLVKGAANNDIVGTLIDASHAGPHRMVSVPWRADSEAATIKVLVADEPGSAREALADLLESEAEFELVAVASNGAEALRLACIHRPHAVLVGRGLPGDSTAAIEEIGQAVPDATLVAYTSELEPRGVREAMEAGAMSYIVRSDRDDHILQALREAAHGRSLLSPVVATAVVRELSVSPAHARERRRRSRRRAAIERFIRGDGLSVALQPIFDVTSREPVAVEALARFDDGASEGPSVWFVEADGEGLGPDLELAALMAAVEALAEVPAHLSMAINVSPSVVVSPRFGEVLDDVPADRVIIELTEHAAVADYAALGMSVGRLRERGLRVAVDDAGAGFASLRHVLLIEPDFLKLDISLCSGISHDRRRRALARALLAFAEETEIRTVAEGVETAEDLTTLQELGIAFAQGFHLAPPGPASALVAAF